MNLRTRLEKYNCAFCDSHFNMSGLLVNHIKETHNSQFECYECGVIVATGEFLENHMKFHTHDNSNEDNNANEENDMKEVKNMVDRAKQFDQLENLCKKLESELVNGEIDHIWNSTDDSVPNGWKTSIVESNSSKYFKYLDGKVLNSRIEAIKYMMKRKTLKSEDIDKLKNGLFEEGWEINIYLPYGWYVKRNPGANLSFLTPDFQLLPSINNAVDLMNISDNYSEDDIERLMAITNHNYAMTKFDEPEVKEDIITDCDVDNIKFEPEDDAFGVKFNDALVEVKSESIDYGKYQEAQDFTNEFWNYNEHVQGPTVPNGWSISFINSDPNRVMIKSPNGKIFRSIVSALQFMRKETYPIEDIHQMCENLGKTGWKMDPNLPSTWMAKSVANGGMNYLLSDFTLLKSTKDAKKCMEKSEFYFSEDIEKLEIFADEESANIMSKMTNSENISSSPMKLDIDEHFRPDNIFETSKVNGNHVKVKTANEKMEKYSWKTENVPTGWQIGEYYDKANSLRIWIISPNGKTFKGFIQALHYMAQVSFPRKDIEIMIGYLEEKGWRQDGLLPSGWLIKTFRHPHSKNSIQAWYLSSTFEKILSTKSAILYLKKNTEDSESHIKNLELNLKEEGKKFWHSNESKPDHSRVTGKMEYSWKDEGVPLGWKIGVGESSNKSRRHFIFSPDGTSFKGVLQALQFMVSQEYSEDDINLMSSHLWECGWITDELLPEGWFMKPFQHSTSKTSVQAQYLTKTFQKLPSTVAAIDFLRNNSPNYETETNNIYLKLDIERKKLIENNFDVISVDSKSKCIWKDNVPVGWKVGFFESSKTQKYFIVSPDGKRFKGITKALRFMVENDYSREDLELMSLNLEDIGWISGDLLPPGWFMKPFLIKNHKNIQAKFLTPNFQKISCITTAIEFLKSTSENYDEEYKNLSEKIKIESKKILTDTTIDYNVDYAWKENVPSGWKMGIGYTINNQIRYNILGPDGSSFRNLIKALNYMVDKKFPEKDVEIMAEHLVDGGWKKDDLLPAGWRIKTFEHPSSENSIQAWYLTPDFKKLLSTKLAIDHLKSTSQNCENKIQNIGLKLKEERRKAFLSGTKLKSKKKLKKTRNNLLKKVGALQQIQQEIVPEKGLPNDSQNKSALEGWCFKVKYSKTDTKSQSRRTLVQSPEGVRFRGILPALQYMYKNKVYMSDIDHMKAKLLDDGWEKHPMLPDGWYLKCDRVCEQMSYLLPNCEVASSTKIAINHMIINSYPYESMQNLQQVASEVLKSCYEEKYDWVSDPETVPQNWKIRIVENTDEEKKKLTYCLGPDGSLFKSVISALQHMLKNGHSKEDMDLMAGNLKIDGWKKSSTELYFNVQNFKHPTFWYLTQEFRLIKSTKDITKFMENSSLYKKEDIATLQNEVKKQLYTILKDRYTSTDASVPKGWKFRTVCRDDGTRKISYLAPTGETFHSTLVTLEYMSKQKYSEIEINKMAANLEKEGWEISEVLPTGWKIKRDSHIQFMSPNFQVSKSIKMALKILELDTTIKSDHFERISKAFGQEFQNHKKRKMEQVNFNEISSKRCKIDET